MRHWTVGMLREALEKEPDDRAVKIQHNLGDSQSIKWDISMTQHSDRGGRTGPVRIIFEGKGRRFKNDAFNTRSKGRKQKANST